MKQEKMIVEQMERLFDAGNEEYLEYFDLNSARRPGLEQQRVNVVLPNWMRGSLDREAERLGVTRQAIIKIWLDEKLQSISA
jgi:hypothetical protein